VALVLALALPAAAHATTGVGAHGPVTEASGWFPDWYEDASGLRLELCVEGRYCLSTAEGGLPHADEPARFPDNFPDEAFWWAGETTLTYPGGSALLVLAQEAAFANGPIVSGDQIAFGRVRIRATGLVPNAWYRFTYPFGQIDLQAVDKAPRVVNYTSDVGCVAAPCADGAFSQLGGSAIGPNFLQWDTTESAPPEGYVGNPAVPHRVTGSTFVPEGEAEPANHFRIDRITGPGGTVTSTVGRTDFFLVQGKLAGPARGHFAAAPVRFDDREVGTSAEREVRIRNTGSGDLPLGTAALAGDDPGEFRLEGGGTCDLPGTLAPGESCTVRVGFAPSLAGKRSAWLEVAQGAAGDDGSSGGGEGGEGSGDSSASSADAAPAYRVALSGTATERPTPAAPVPPAAPAPAAQAPAGLVPGVTVLGSTARSTRPAVRQLTVRSRIERARVRAEGLRLVLRIAGEANVVRVRIHRMRATRKGARVAEAFRPPTSNPVRLRLSGADLRRRLTPGRYRIEVAAGTSRAALGTVAATTFRVVR
jgi:hypothetical protein